MKGPDDPSGQGGLPGREAGEGERRLWLQARAVAPNAYAPYSGLRVGAAARATGGGVHLGVNVENAAFPAGLCAERAALATAVTSGDRSLTAVAVAAADGRDLVPCGACLQALSEFAPVDLVVQVDGRLRVVPLHELLTTPFAFAAPS